MGYKTANSIEKEVTFYCKLRTELALSAPYYYGYNAIDHSNLYRDGSGVSLNENIHYSFQPASSFNRVHQLVDFGQKTGDWTNSYENGVWTVNATRDWDINIDLSLQFALRPYVYNNGWFNSAPGKINGGIIGKIRLYKLPASSSTIIPIGGRINPLESNPFVNLADIQLLKTREFFITYNQNQGNYGNDFYASAGGNQFYRNGTGSVDIFDGSSNASNNPYDRTDYSYSWGGGPTIGASHWNTPSFTTHPSESGSENGEYYNTATAFHSIDNPMPLNSNQAHELNRINTFSGTHYNNSGNQTNEYSISTVESLESGDRIFIVVSGSYNQFSNSLLAGYPDPPGPIDINNNSRVGGILYQWAGSGGNPNKNKNQPTWSLSRLILQKGNFKAKTVL